MIYIHFSIENKRIQQMNYESTEKSEKDCLSNYFQGNL